jgi:twinkle protein
MSNMIDDLIGEGIRLKSYSTGTHKTTCPKCSHTRKKKNDPCLYVNIETPDLALWKCYNCDYTGKAGKSDNGYATQKKERTYKKPETQKDPKTLPDAAVKWMEKRGFTKEFVNRMEAKKYIWWDNDKKSIALPFYVNNEVINIKYRGINKKFFSLSAGAKLVVYGYDVCKGSKQYKEKKEIIIVEGEMDVLALNMCGIYNVVSVPNGAPAENTKNLATHLNWLNEHESFFKEANEIVIAVDNDSAGHRLEAELARRIGTEKCSRVRWPLKDANDMLMDLGVDEVLNTYNEAKEPYPIKGLYKVNDFRKDVHDFYEHGVEKGLSTGWPNVDRFYTVASKQVTIVTGIPNSGKSEWLDALMINMMNSHNWNFSIFSPENGASEHISKLTEKVVQKPIDPKQNGRMSKEELDLALDKLNSHFYFEVTDDNDDPPTIDWILDKAKQAIYRYGVKGIVIDPYNEIEHKREAGFNETDYISKFLSKIKRFAKVNDVHIWVVAHPAKMQKDKDGIVQAPGLYDISGSAHWVNKTDNGVVVHRSNDSKGGTEIWVRKVRFKWIGRQGKCNLIYNIAKGLYYTPKSEKDDHCTYSMLEDEPYVPEETKVDNTIKSY